MLKKTSIFLLTTTLMIGTASIAKADSGWIKTEDNKYQYQNENETLVTNSWIAYSEKWYYLDGNGYMKTGWLQDKDGTWYWLEGDGTMAANVTYEINGLSYRFQENGAFLGNWQQDEIGYWYLRKDKTFPQTEWFKINDNWYYFDESGYMKTGWFTENEASGPWFYLKENGSMVLNDKVELDNYIYSFDENGVCISKEEAKTKQEIELEEMAKGISAKIITDNMTDIEQLKAIYTWVTRNINYISTSAKDDWVAEAIHGIKTRRGDCFTYFSVTKALLDAAGFENLSIYPVENARVHYWNLVYLPEGWFHLDTTPRMSGSTFFLLTDAELEAYSNKSGGTHIWDKSLYPATPIEPLTRK